nr:histidine kinase dimerization/phosphoacceptor domain -containing protein [Sphingomonas jejuensis]
MGPDVAACDREPIHRPGSIQPHGLLLIADPADLTVVGGAGDIEGVIAPEWIGLTVDALLGQDVRGRIESADLLDGTTLALDPYSHAGQDYSVLAHRTEGAVLIELEPDEGSWTASRLLTALDAVTTAFERAADLQSLCNAAATAFRELIGYDRVMIYRFLDDDAGVVVAESRSAEIGSFMNHHFPASDIPKQARALYIQNRVRVIPDVGYTPQPLRPDGRFADQDLSCVGLRSVSPVHVQYLKNMGVGASASISIVKDGVLWGLIACHNSTPRTISHGVRTTARALASGFARQVRAKEDAENYRERIRLRGSEDAAVAKLGNGVGIDDFFTTSSEDLRRMMGADGFAVLQGTDLVTTGHLPAEDQVREIGMRFSQRALGQPVATAALETIFPPASRFREQASGLLAVTMSTEEPIILMWFRVEQIEVVNWAGNPHKAVDLKPGETLSPRASFEAWSEAVRGRSRAWTLAEIEAATRLRRTLFEARQTRRLRELNRELSATIVDKEALLVQKDYLMREVNHRVQNSLQLVGSFLSMQGRAGGDAQLSASLGEAQRRLSAVALVHRRLYADDRIEAVDLARYVEELAEEITESMDPAWKAMIRLDLAPILISTDRAVNVGLILTELVINANKYAYAGAPGPISISLEQIRNRFRLIVADQGAGKTKAGSGFGTRMLSAMVARLDGTIEEQEARPGLRVVLTAPLQDS